MSSLSMESSLTIRDVLKYLLGEHFQDQESDAFLRWPPDVYGVAAYILRESGGYVSAVNPDTQLASTSEQWSKMVKEVGDKWRQAYETPPHEVQNLWKQLLDRADLKLIELVGSGHDVEMPDDVALRTKAVLAALITLLVVADVACEGFGVPESSKQADNNPSDAGRLAKRAEAALMLWEQSEKKKPSSLCRRLDPAKLVVLPKMHTPQSGMTIRSLSHHLAIATGSDVEPRWLDWTKLDPKTRKPVSEPRHNLNLLVVPWPLEVYPSQFQPASPTNGPIDHGSIAGVLPLSAA